MSEARPGAWNQLVRVAGALSVGQRISLVMAVAAILGVIWGLVWMAGQVEYEVLYAGLDPDEAGEIVEVLRGDRVPYRLEAGGRTIEVPGDQVDDLRLSLAGEGLPRGGGVGFEIFDKSSLGASEFVQGVNFQRALERELQRTIESLDAVAGARVHLVLPEETLFVSEPREAKASVVLRLKGGRRPGHREVAAITQLVASSVDGLSTQRVSVIDGEGNLLSGGEEDDPDETGLSSQQVERKAEVERGMEKKIVALLEPVVGVGRVRAQADVDLDFQRISTTEEIYDPANAAVRSEQKSKQKTTQGGTSGSSDVGGPAGTASNLPPEDGPPPSPPLVLEESSDVSTAFEINRTVRNVVVPAGGIRRISLAVVVDNALPSPEPAEGEDEAPAPVSAPRSDEEMEKITDLVKAGCGFDASRGDTLTVENIPFEELRLDAAEGAPLGGPAQRHFWLQLVKWPSMALAVLLLLMLVVRPALRSLREAVSAAALPAHAGSGLLGAGEARALEEGLGPPAKTEILRRRLLALAAEEPEGAAQVVKAWLAEGRTRS